MVPPKLRVSGLEGGTLLWERAQVMWHLQKTVSEFDGLSQEDQNWAFATWRTKQKVANIKLIDQSTRS